MAVAGFVTAMVGVFLATAFGMVAVWWKKQADEWERLYRDQRLEPSKAHREQTRTTS